MTRTLLSVALAAALAQPVAAQSVNDQETLPTSGGSVPISYVGSNARVSLGVDQDLRLLGDLFFVLAENDHSAWLAEGWLGHGGAGGAKLGYNWLWGGMTGDDSINRPHEVTVAKAFLAVDQNAFDDRKATLGVGFEREHGFVDVYASRALSDERLLSSNNVSTQREITGTDNGRPWRQIETTNTITHRYAKPYDWGVGVRGGRFFDESLLRLRAGLDYEKGDHKSHQTTFSVGLDKFFSGSNHSLSVQLETYRKDGLFELDKSDTRGWVMWRYDFGSKSAFRPTQMTKDVQVTREVEVAAEQAQVVRNEVTMSADAFFKLDSARINDDIQDSLGTVLDTLQSDKRVSRVSIVGHTCDLGAAAYNQNLSERRAQAVRDFLVAKGVPAEECDVSGLGETSPKFANTDEASRSQNRRVDVSFLTVEEQPQPATTTQTVTEWVQEPVAAPAPWIQRALRHPASHKRTVDVYHFETVDTKTELGDREYLNRGPQAVDDSASQHECSTITIPVLANDTDPDGDALSLVSVETPANGGSVTKNADGTVSYQPAAGSSICAGGSDTFRYTIADSNGAQASANVTVSYTNAAPIAQDDRIELVSRAGGATSALYVMQNDRDPDGDELSITEVTQPTHGTVSFNASTGLVEYTLNTGYVGEDEFTYTITDGRETSTATVYVTAKAPRANKPPVAVDDAAATPQDTAITINVLTNDSDPDFDELQVVSTTNPANGSVSIGSGGNVTYTPNAGYIGQDTFRYTVFDTEGAEATANVTITVTKNTAGNNAPIAQDDYFSYYMNRPAYLYPLTNDSDPDGDALKIIDVQGVKYGTIEIVDDGKTLYYTPNQNSRLTENLTYTISDGNGGTATANIILVDP